MYATARLALQELTVAGASLHVAAQNLIEFWVVATRPVSSNGLGLTPAQAATEVNNFKAACQLLPDSPVIFAEWERLVMTYHVEGKQAHDARLVGVMKAHGIGKILTFNAADFNRFVAGEGITIVDPNVVAASP
jgi:predicted nucleic acid-binding protein